jgi:hypothetical protein
MIAFKPPCLKLFGIEKQKHGRTCQSHDQYNPCDRILMNIFRVPIHVTNLTHA